MSYVLQLAAESDVPLLTYWGERVDDTVAMELAQHSHTQHRGWESSVDGLEEYPADSGMRFVTPALSARFPDGGRAVRWEFSESSVVSGDSGVELRLRFDELTRAMRLTMHYRVPTGVDAIERWVTIENAGETSVELLRADSASWHPPLYENYRLSRLHGRWAAETQLIREPLSVGHMALSSRRTTTSFHTNPWIALDNGEATENRGDVFSVALAWSGTWRIDVERLQNGRVAVTAGAGHESPIATLAAGESYEAPRSVGVWSRAGFGGASRIWHRYVTEHVLPASSETRPVLYNSWEATGFDLDEANQMALATTAAAIGCELFVMDDGWFGQRTSDAAGLGDWTPNIDRFPRGLGPLIDHVHGLGMQFGLWVEPEMVNVASELYREHPDWVYGSAGYPRDEMRNQLVLNLARADVAAWLFDWLDALLRDNDISFIKWDMNRPVSDLGWPGEEHPERAWRDHTRNLYDILDRIRLGHPDVRFESCASGGARVDLGILARTDQVWPSDNTDASDRLSIQEGFSQLYPARVMTAWVTDSPNYLTGRQLPLRFRFHCAMAGVLGVGGHLGSWSGAELAEATEMIAIYKTIRDVVQHGIQYRLRGERGREYVVAYSSPDGSEIVMLHLLDGQRFGTLAQPVQLPFVDSGARYRDVDSGESYSGTFLQERGLDNGLTHSHDSAMVRLARE